MGNTGTLNRRPGLPAINGRSGALALRLGHTEIRQNDLPNPVATYKSHWGGGGTLTFSDGARFLVSCSGVWHHVWSLLDENGRTVLSVGPHSRRVLLSRPQGANLASEDHDRLLFLIVFL